MSKDYKETLRDSSVPFDRPIGQEKPNDTHAGSDGECVG